MIVRSAFVYEIRIYSSVHLDDNSFGLIFFYIGLPGFAMSILIFWGSKSEVAEFKIWFKTTADTRELRNLQSEFLQSQQSSEQYFLPYVWLDICSFIINPGRSLGSRHRSYDWLQEFTKPSYAEGLSTFTPDNFSRSILKFNEAPDKVIQRLERCWKEVIAKDLGGYYLIWNSAYCVYSHFHLLWISVSLTINF